jgi:membrane-bound lytic murein transglycosylase D
MPITGRQYLRINRAIDERRDPLESSRAAASYLKQAYEVLGSWPLAITSYNFGIGGIARAAGDIGSNELMDLIQRYNHRNWGFAPKQFYAEFLAAVEIGSNLDQYFPGLDLETATPIQEMELAANTSISSVMKATGLTRNELLGWNPALNSSLGTLPAGYRVKFPNDRTVEPLVDVAQTQSPPARQPQPQVVHHRVKQGETLIQIARRYGASVKNILQANGLRQAHTVRAGTTLVIPKI